MAATKKVNRKDPKGRVLREGESWRESDQRYVYKWRPQKGAKQKAIYASDLNELRKKEAEIKRDIYTGVVTNRITLNEMYDRLMETKGENGLRVTTSTNYNYMYDKYVRPTPLGRMQISDIKYSTLLKFYTDLLDINHFKVHTLDNIHTLIHPTLDLAVRDNLIRSNPSDGLLAKIKKDRHLETTRKEGLSQEEQEAFLDFVSNSSTYRHWLPLFICFFGLGARASELLSLTWNDIDFTNKTVSINHQLIYHQLPDKSCGYVLSLPKTQKGIRTIHMFPEVYEALKETKEAQEISHPKQPIIEGYTDFVFLNRENYIHNRATVNKAIQRIVRDYNIFEEVLAAKEKREAFLLKPFSCHIMRHSLATRLFEADAPAIYAQEMLGHSDYSTTMSIYTSLMEKKKKEIETNIDSKISLRKKAPTQRRTMTDSSCKDALNPTKSNEP